MASGGTSGPVREGWLIEALQNEEFRRAFVTELERSAALFGAVAALSAEDRATGERVARSMRELAAVLLS